MALLKHFEYIPDHADTNVRFQLRHQEPSENGEARIALTICDLDESDDLTVQLSPPDLEGLIEALEQTLEGVAPSEAGGEEADGEEEADEPQPERPEEDEE